MTSVQGSGPFAAPLLTVREVADVLRVSKMTVYRLIKTGELPAFRIGKNYRIRQPELEAFLAAGAINSDERSV
jgi:excisionase family DNA binding protein